MNKDQAKEQIQALVDEFAGKEAFYKSKEYAEENIKVNFITPFFKALGWDTQNQDSSEVVYEDRTRIEGRIKRPDYGFYLNNKRQFFLEAKAAHEDLKNNWSLAHQLKAYGWSSKLKISILTDFEELAIYDCRYAPERQEESSLHRIKYLNYKEYIKEFDFIWNNLSREAVLKGSLDRLVKDIKNIEKEAVDKKFLDFLEEERIRLAGEIAKLNPSIGQFELNKALVKLINRIVFLRIAEDRDIEIYGELQELVDRSKKEKALESLSDIKEKPKVQNLELIYPELKILFAKANEKYNSEMFELDKTDLELHIKDQVLYHFIENLYYPNSPYIFDAISIDVLGSTYERFLGSIVVLSPLHEAIVEQKPEVRKAGGVYYTPKYIVDYIVENTVGKLITPQPPCKGEPENTNLRNKTKRNKSSEYLTEEIKNENSPFRRLGGLKPEEVSKIKILDPACGSGSFLIGVYEYLLDWHLKYYSQASPKEQKDNIDFVEGKPRLTIKLKKQILLNNIFGVDIDEQAINVTKLSLCLKCLEGETQHSLRNQLALFKTQALPTLKDNIKCGNSLISSDFAKYELGFNKWNEDEQRKINPFNWEREFPQVFNKSLNQDSPDLKISKINKETKSRKSSNQENQGSDGFDIVIGNPPWGADLRTSKKYFKDHFSNTSPDSAAYFFDLASKLSKNKLGFIVPKTISYYSAWESIRNVLFQENYLENVLDVGLAFPEVNLESVVLIFNKKINSVTQIKINQAEPLKRPHIPKQLIESGFYESKLIDIAKSIPMISLSKQESKLIEKLDQEAIKLGSVYEDIFRGLYIPDSDKALLQQGNYKFINKVPDVKRYSLDKVQNIDLTKEEWKTKAKKIMKPRIFLKVLRGKRLVAFPDSKGEFLTTEKLVNVIVDQNKYSCSQNFLSGIINSKVASFFIQKVLFSDSTETSRVMDRIYSQYIVLPQINKKSQTKIIKLVDEILSLNEQKKTASEYQIQRILQPQIDEIDKAIDKLVYDLYGLTDEEIKIVEGVD